MSVGVKGVTFSGRTDALPCVIRMTGNMYLVYEGTRVSFKITRRRPGGTPEVGHSLVPPTSFLAGPLESIVHQAPGTRPPPRTQIHRCWGLDERGSLT